MTANDIKLIREAYSYIASALKATQVNANTHALVDLQAAQARITSILDRNPLPWKSPTP